MDSFAVPSLVLLMHKDKSPAKQRRYASYQLDRMDRARPSKAIATAPDDNIREGTPLPASDGPPPLPDDYVDRPCFERSVKISLIQTF